MRNYTESLSKDALEQYTSKLKCLGVRTEGQDVDPYKLPDSVWIDDISKWPPVDYPSLYNYLIDTPGQFTREKLKAYKSLEAYNYYRR